MRVTHISIIHRPFDGRIFAIDSGLGLNTTGHAVCVTNEHRKVMKMMMAG